MTKLQVRHRLSDMLPQLEEAERERVADEVAERYRLPMGKRSRWRVVEPVALTLPPFTYESVVERSDESHEVYSDATLGHRERAQAVAVALNAIEDEIFAPPVAPLD